MDKSHKSLIEQIPLATIVDQPASVAELSAVLLSRYQVENGTIRIAGCSIDDDPIFELSTPTEQATSFCDRTGNPIASELADAIGLHNIETVDQIPRHVRPAEFERDFAHVQNVLLDSAFLQQETQITRVIWAKRALGKITFSIGDANEQVTFDGWTKQLASGKAVRFPFICPATKLSGYSIVADGQGKLTVPDAIRVCAITGESRVFTDLVQSSLSDRWAIPESIAMCCFSGDRLIADEKSVCPRCLQEISPTYQKRFGCDGCLRIPSATQDLREKYRALIDSICNEKSKNKIRIRETDARVYLLNRSFWTQSLFIVDKQTATTLLHRRANRWFGGWKIVD